jgi:hypothetical protein
VALLRAWQMEVSDWRFYESHRKRVTPLRLEGS